VIERLLREMVALRRLGAEEHLGRCPAAESLMWPDEYVARERDFEPPLQALDGQGAAEAEAKRRRTPSRLAALAKTCERNSPPTSVMRYLGGADLGDVYHPDVVDEARDDGSRRLRGAGASRSAECSQFEMVFGQTRRTQAAISGAGPPRS
jgi:hypothetical protein